jgi:hypothetical protein
MTAISHSTAISALEGTGVAARIGFVQPDGTSQSEASSISYTPASSARRKGLEWQLALGPAQLQMVDVNYLRDAGLRLHVPVELNRRSDIGL